LGGFGERRGDPQCTAGVDSKFGALFVTANTNQAGNRTDVHYGQFRSVDIDVAVGPQVQASAFVVTAAPDRRLARCAAERQIARSGLGCIPPRPDRFRARAYLIGTATA
jgi:hypothetical protein